MLVVNHGSNKLNISVKDIVDSLKRQIVSVIPEDEAAYAAADQGKPLVSGPWQRRPAATALIQLSQHLAKDLAQDEELLGAASGASTTRLSRLFGR
jgi:septum formation inhibitor-activating ATPase MinD